jgi:hypothetical protein
MDNELDTPTYEEFKAFVMAQDESKAIQHYSGAAWSTCAVGEFLSSIDSLELLDDKEFDVLGDLFGGYDINNCEFEENTERGVIGDQLNHSKHDTYGELQTAIRFEESK